MSADVSFGPLPGPCTRRYDHKAIAAALRERPGEWALILTDAPNAHAFAIRHGQLTAYRPTGDYESTSRRQPGYAPGRADIWARYVGDVSA